MENCNHVFMGHAEGVTCKRCGLRMTTDEYMAYLATPSAKKPKRTKKQKEEPEHE